MQHTSIIDSCCWVFLSFDGFCCFMPLMVWYFMSLYNVEINILMPFSFHIMLVGPCGLFLFYINPGKGKSEVKGVLVGYDSFGLDVYNALLTQKVLGCQLVCAMLMVAFLSRGLDLYLLRKPNEM